MQGNHQKVEKEAAAVWGSSVSTGSSASGRERLKVHKDKVHLRRKAADRQEGAALVEACVASTNQSSVTRAQ
ncbi:unnamed protein product [Arctogadus glacialis]